MSRIGNAPIEIPANIDLSFDDKEKVVTVKGPKGELTQKIHPKISIKIEDGTLNVTREDDLKESRSMHGLYRSLIYNMIQGVSSGWKKELELIGVGYRASAKGQLLELSLGFSHPIIFSLPEEIKVTAEMEKGKAPKVTLESFDKQLIGMVAAKIRSFRKPEPYKGKGVRYVGEQVRRKAGKTASA